MTEQVLALVTRARESLAKFSPSSVNAGGVFHHPPTQLAALKAARDHIDKAIVLMEPKQGKKSGDRHHDEAKHYAAALYAITNLKPDLPASDRAALASAVVACQRKRGLIDLEMREQSH